MASHGARFVNAHSQAVVTLVSHTSILSGQYPIRPACATTPASASPQTVTLASKIEDAGYLDRRVHRRIPLTNGSASRAGSTRRRSHRRNQRAPWSSRCRNAAPTSSAKPKLDQRPGRQEVLRVGARVRPARAGDPPEQWKAQYRKSVSRRSGLTDSALGAVRSSRDAATENARDHHGRPRRRPRRARRNDARLLRTKARCALPLIITSRSESDVVSQVARRHFTRAPRRHRADSLTQLANLPIRN